MKSHLYRICVIAGLTLITNNSAFALAYSVTNLGTLGGPSAALAISDDGQYIVGETDTPNGIRATLFQRDGIPVSLPATPHNPFGRAFGVNKSGSAVGIGIFSPWGMSATLFSSGTAAQNLGAIGGREYGSQANAINNAGQVVGISTVTTDGWSHAALFGSGTTPIDLGVLPGGNWSNARAISNTGVIGGSAQGGWGAHAVLFGTSGAPIDLDPLETSATSAVNGLSDAGHIVGVRQYLGWTPTLGYTTIQRAMLFSIDAAPTDLGDLGGLSSRSNDVNSAGQIVGASTMAGEAEMRAALFRVGQTPIDINELIDPLSGWILSEATAINERGEIVGYGRFNGEIRAFLATPVPEPETLSLLLCGLVLLTSASRKSRFQNAA